MNMPGSPVIERDALLAPFRSTDVDRDLLRHQRRLEVEVHAVAQHELQRLLSGGQFDPNLGLARAVVEVLPVLWDRLARTDLLIGVEPEMMMAAVRKTVAGMRNSHMAEPEAAPERALHGVAVGRRDDIDVGVLRRALHLSQ